MTFGRGKAIQPNLCEREKGKFGSSGRDPLFRMEMINLVSGTLYGNGGGMNGGFSVIERYLGMSIQYCISLDRYQHNTIQHILMASIINVQIPVLYRFFSSKYTHRHHYSTNTC